MAGFEDEKLLEVDNECGKEEKEDRGKGVQERSSSRVNVGWKRLRRKWRWKKKSPEATLLAATLIILIKSQPNVWRSTIPNTAKGTRTSRDVRMLREAS